MAQPFNLPHAAARRSASTSTQRVSVVICAYTAERWTELQAAVESVAQQRVQPFELVLVADHNPRLLARMQAEFGGRSRVIENRFERGLSGARNSGVLTARGDVVAFIDDDAVAHEDWLLHLGSSYQQSHVLGVGGAIEPMWTSSPPAWFPDEFHWVVGCSYKGLPQAAAPVRNLLGCNMSFRREVFPEVGGFRSGLGRIGKNPLGCEETELCIRVLRRWPERVLLYQPAARVHHRVRNLRGTHRYFRSRCYSEGLSKARVARLVGSSSGLASERAYAARTLPRGVLAGLSAALTGGGPHHAARAGAIMLGLAYTLAGYAWGRVAGAGLAAGVAA